MVCFWIEISYGLPNKHKSTPSQFVKVVPALLWIGLPADHNLGHCPALNNHRCTKRGVIVLDHYKILFTTTKIKPHSQFGNEKH